MLSAVALLVLTLLSGAARAEESAYLLLDGVKHPLTARQPAWIALRQLAPGRRMVHLPVGKGITAIEPGRYRISHVDFQESAASGIGTLYSPPHKSQSFDAAAGMIQFVGLLEIRRGGVDGNYSPEYQIYLSPSPDLLTRACISEPELLARLPLRVVAAKGKSRLLQVRCEP